MTGQYVIRTSLGDWVRAEGRQRNHESAEAAYIAAYRASQRLPEVRVSVYRIDGALPVWDRTYINGKLEVRSMGAAA